MPTMSGPGNAAIGAPFALCEFVDFVAQISLANGASLPQGSIAYRDVTQLVGIAGQVGTSATSTESDQVVLGSSANAGRLYGVYQGPTITNNSGATQVYTLLWRKTGAGVLYATAKNGGTAVTVGANMIGEPTTDQYAVVGAFATGKEIGMAIATGAVVAPGGSIIVVPGSGQTNALINCDIAVA